MARRKDVDWFVEASNPSIDGAQLAVLMDLRDELKTLNRLLHCWRFQAIPVTLSRIDSRIAKNMPLRKSVKRRETK